MAEDDKKDAVILRPKEVNTKLASYKGKANLLTPYARTEFDNIMKGFIPVIRETYIDPNPDNKEVYNSPEGKGQLALTKISLQKLAKLAGIKWVYTRRTDTREDARVAAYVACGTMRDVDGNVIQETKSGDIDLRDGTPQATAMKPDQLKIARRHVAALAETKAMDRVIRALLGLNASYSPEDLKKPFVILKLALDPNDDRVARMLQEDEAGIRNAVFGQSDPQEDDLSDIPAVPGTEGLGIPPVPGDPAPPQGTIVDVTAEHVNEMDRQDKINRINELYYLKVQAGKRDPSKPALTALADNALDDIIKMLEPRPDIRKPIDQEDLI